MDTQTQQWLQQAKQSGMTDEQIRQQLIQGGWEAGDIAVALGSLQQKNVPNQPGFTPTPGVEYTPKNYTIGKHIFRRAFAETKSSYKYFLSILAIGIAFICLVVFLVVPQVRSSNIGMLAVFLVCWLTILLITFSAAIIVTIKPTSHSELLKRVVEKLPKMIWSSILAGIVVSGGYLMFIFPGILMALAFTALPFVVVRENVYGFRALQRCYSLVRGFRGNIFGAHVILGLVMLGFFIAELVVSFILLIVVNRTVGGVAGFTFGFLATFLPIFILYTIFPLFYAAYNHILYTDLHAIRPPGTDTEIEEKSKIRLLIYIFVGVIAIGLYVNTYVSYFKSIKPVTEQQYVSINAELACYMYNNGFMNIQISKLDTEARTVKNQEAALKVPTEVQKILTSYGVTELGIQSFESRQNADEANVLIQKVKNKAVQDCGYVDEVSG